MRTTVPPLTFTVSTGMVSRVYYDEKGKITRHEVVDKFGRPVEIPCGELPSAGCDVSPVLFETEKSGNSHFPSLFRERLPRWDFGTIKAALDRMTESFPPRKRIEELTKIYDHLPGWDTGTKDRGAVAHLLKERIDFVLDRVEDSQELVRITSADAGKLAQPATQRSGSCGGCPRVQSRGNRSSSSFELLPRSCSSLGLAKTDCVSSRWPTGHWDGDGSGLHNRHRCRRLWQCR